MPEQPEAQELQQQYDNDLKELVDTYRTMKRVGMWLAKFFAFLLVIATLWLTIKQIFK